MKNRTIIGIICIVLALVVTFAVAPLVNKLADSRIDIVRITRDVTRGHIIDENDVEVVTVGAHNLPTNVLVKKEDVVGKFASVDLKVGDYLLPSKVSTAVQNSYDLLMSNRCVRSDIFGRNIRCISVRQYASIHPKGAKRFIRIYRLI